MKYGHLHCQNFYCHYLKWPWTFGGIKYKKSAVKINETSQLWTNRLHRFEKGQSIVPFRMKCGDSQFGALKTNLKIAAQESFSGNSCCRLCYFLHSVHQCSQMPQTKHFFNSLDQKIMANSVKRQRVFYPFTSKSSPRPAPNEFHLVG